MPEIPPKPDDSLLRLFGETAETVRFYCFDVPKLGITIRESKTLMSWLAKSGGEVEPKTIGDLAKALELETDAFTHMLLEHGVDLFIPPSKNAMFEAKLAWVAWCLNNRGMQFEGREVTADDLEVVMPYAGVNEFERLLTPGSAGGEGNASR